MDVALSAEEQEFARDLRRWIEMVPRPDGLRDYGATPTADDIEPARAWQRLLHDAGWAGLSWPEVFGGRAASLMEQALFAEEMARAGVPRQLNLVGLELAGPMVMAFGRDDQRGRLLAPTLRGDVVWCQLFSEPGAGSDLAGLATRAVPAGDGWQVKGQKVWTSGAHYADVGLLLARTDPESSRHRGITCFILPMDRPGITVRPIHQMDGEAKFNEVFLDDVTVSADDVLGDVGDGWRVAVSTLGRERLTLGAQAVALEEVLGRLGERLDAGDSIGRAELARLWARTRLLRLTWLRMLGGPDEGREARMSVLKLSASELQQAVWQLGARVGGARFCAGDASSSDRQRFLAARGATIAGGTSEVQRNIIAERVLGLPR